MSTIFKNEPLPCVCGTKPVYKDEGGMIDILACPKCGLEGSPFFDGEWGWLVKDWNLMISKKTRGR